MVRKLVLLGTGLIGGSFALALKRAQQVAQVVGVGRSQANLERALELGVIDAASQDPAQAVQGADLVLIAAPVGQMQPLMQAIAPNLAGDCLVTDAGSTKRDVVGLYRAHLAAHLPACVPGHPIAGSDLSGAAAARYGLYEGRRVVLTPLPESAPEAIERLETLWRLCGAAVYRMSPEEHDSVFAAVSHVPHLVAFAYMNALLEHGNVAQCLDFAATGFRDFTRIAGSHPEMWRDIALANREAVLADLQRNVGQLQALIHLLEAGDAAGLTHYIERASSTRVAWEARTKGLSKP
ncbi:prephenate dehydrogenase/arogenate dehydrogenase family protein [Chitiniphilus purpureus]|uniref:Prephenate dehydrogenase/arogenate dehydrogenase family protein n=1 Tax=Chitiniphilus purpureus TaxID=2981137 RepID=A0ABY6DJ61_9NEIS|nr:prephenate dehydrogenase/arogenate dehydrogenase family protein [Chitiniphilus sp. CD1]UXY13718.1 prephenate dehydrogenase/arogenate dehydrogenase family protein [Chitiniphilus sp. CD1]